ATERLRWRELPPDNFNHRQCNRRMGGRDARAIANTVAAFNGGTKGSHLFTFSARLRAALGGQGIYAEASDGRPIFITLLADTILIGTTDEPFEGLPENALATNSERDYLLHSVNAILPDVELTPDDVDF